MTDSRKDNHPGTGSAGENEAADAGSESPEEGAAAMAAAEDAVVDDDTPA